MDKEAIKTKRRARKMAVQALYQWLMTGQDIYEIEAQFRSVNDMARIDGEYFRTILYGVPKHLDALQEQIIPFIDRPIKELNPIELTVLRLAVFEFLHAPEIPYRVVLDEAISLAKEFGSQDGHRYVNGVLNQVAKQARATEIRLEN